MNCIKDQKQDQKNQNDTLDRPEEQQVEVLYQKLGDRWFAFSLIQDEIFFGSIAQSEIDSVYKSNII